MKALSVIVWVAYPVVLIMLFASLLTSHPYMRISKGMYETHALIECDHDTLAEMLIDYLNYRRDDLLNTCPETGDFMLTDAEISHMEDVLGVYTMLRIIAGVALVLVIASSVYLWVRARAVFYWTFKHIFWLPLAIVVMLGGWIAFDFDHAFHVFHLLFFEDNWQFPHHSNMIRLLPIEFWMTSAILILLGTVFTMVLTIVLNRYLVRRTVK